MSETCFDCKGKFAPGYIPILRGGNSTHVERTLCIGFLKEKLVTAEQRLSIMTADAVKDKEKLKASTRQVKELEELLKQG